MGLLHKLKDQKILNKRQHLIRGGRVSYREFYREFKIKIQLWKSATVRITINFLETNKIKMRLNNNETNKLKYHNNIVIALCLGAAITFIFKKHLRFGFH